MMKSPSKCLLKNRLKSVTLDCEDNLRVFWHGSASGDLRGGETGLHIGTKKAATEALEARIGIPATGEWNGKRQYGKTLLAGKKRLRKLELAHKKWITGLNVDAPEEDYYPQKILKYPDGTAMPMTVKPEVAPFVIAGEMTNTPSTAYDDWKANGYMRANLKKGRAKRGYFYVNVGEDEGSISATVPNGCHLFRVKCRR